MKFHENRLLADDSHETLCLICYFWKKQQNLKLLSAANYRWRFMNLHHWIYWKSEGNVSGHWCVSHCRSRGREFDHCPVPYFRVDWSWNNFTARSHTLVEIDHEIMSTVILLPSAESFRKGCCQLQAKVCAQSTGYPLVQACPGKKCGQVNWPSRHDHSSWLAT